MDGFYLVNLGMVRCIGFGVGKVGTGFSWFGNLGVMLVGCCGSCVRYQVVCNNYDDKRASFCSKHGVMYKCTPRRLVGTLVHKNELLKIFWRHIIFLGDWIESKGENG